MYRPTRTELIIISSVKHGDPSKKLFSLFKGLPNISHITPLPIGHSVGINEANPCWHVSQVPRRYGHPVSTIDVHLNAHLGLNVNCISETKILHQLRRLLLFFLFLLGCCWCW